MGAFGWPGCQMTHLKIPIWADIGASSSSTTLVNYNDYTYKRLTTPCRCIPMTEPTQGAAEPRLPRITIQFCTQCKWMLRAAYVSLLLPPSSYAHISALSFTHSCIIYALLQPYLPSTLLSPPPVSHFPPTDPRPVRLPLTSPDPTN
jgi:hypothetical protein